MAEFPSGSEIQSRIKVRALALAESSGVALLELAEESVGHLAWITGELADVAKGDARARAHLEAQLSGIEFQAKATAYLEAVAWRRALVEVIEELAGEALELGLSLGAEALKGLLASMAES